MCFEGVAACVRACNT